MPILRYLSRELGSYDGKTNAEKYAVDEVADLYIDWRVSVLKTSSALLTSQAQWVPQLSKKTDEYRDNFAPEYYRLLALYYTDHGGPFLLGDTITYADFAVYQSIDNDTKIGTIPASPKH